MTLVLAEKSAEIPMGICKLNEEQDRVMSISVSPLPPFCAMWDDPLAKVGLDWKRNRETFNWVRLHAVEWRAKHVEKDVLVTPATAVGVFLFNDKSEWIQLAAVCSCVAHFDSCERLLLFGLG